MPSVSQKTIRTTQPQTAVGIDWSNPITRGLVACLDANRRVLINGSETRPLTLSNPIRRASQQEYGSTTYQTAMQAIKAPPAASSNVTMLSLFVPSTEVIERTYGQLGQTATGSSFSISSGDGATAGVVRFKVYLGSTRTIGASQANAGVPNLAIARHINGKSQNLWLNGVKDAASGAFTGNSVGFGYYGYQTTSSVGASILNAVWNCALTDAEIKSLSENPWQIFAPERRVIAFDVSAPSGDITLTGSNSDCATSSSTDSINVAVSLSSSLSSAQCDSSVGNITLSYDLSADTSTVECVSSTSAITQGHLLIDSASSSATTSSTGTVTTGSELVCSPDNIATTSSTGSIVQAHQLLVGSTSSVSSTSSVYSITQVHALVTTSSSVETNSAAGTITSGLIINLVGSVSNCVTEMSTGVVEQVINLIGSVCNVVVESLTATVSVVNNLIGSASIVITESIGKSIFLPDGYHPSLTRTSSVASEVRLVVLGVENRRFAI